MDEAVLISDQPCSLWSHPAIYLYRWVCIRASTLVTIFRLCRKISWKYKYSRDKQIKSSCI